MKSKSCELNVRDFKRILVNLIIFSLPTFVLVFVSMYSETNDVRASLLTASISFLTVIVDTIKKYREGD